YRIRASSRELWPRCHIQAFLSNLCKHDKGLTMKKTIQPSHTWYDAALTGTAAAVGYMGFEYGVQNSMTNAAALENLTGINEQTLRHQGSDFFGAAFLASSLGHMTTNVLFHI